MSKLLSVFNPARRLIQYLRSSTSKLPNNWRQGEKGCHRVSLSEDNYILAPMSLLSIDKLKPGDIFVKIPASQENAWCNALATPDSRDKKQRLYSIVSEWSGVNMVEGESSRL